MIAYHLFEPHMRAKGIGTRALNLLIRYVREETPLRQLIIITSIDNVASQGLAIKNGFRLIGPSREDPVNGMVFALEIARA